MQVAIIGAGYVGLVTAGGLADLGHSVRLGEAISVIAFGLVKPIPIVLPFSNQAMFRSLNRVCPTSSHVASNAT
jgi:heterodisulfide reductase subunit A-like polyferredoxin